MDASGTHAPPASSYSRYHRKYYEAHREAISLKRKDAKPWLAYYAEHAEQERARKREAYRRKKETAADEAPSS